MRDSLKAKGGMQSVIRGVASYTEQSLGWLVVGVLPYTMVISGKPPPAIKSVSNAQVHCDGVIR